MKLLDTYHKPVLVSEVIQYLAPKDGGLYIDATFGGGGHTTAILKSNQTCKIIAIDWDKNAIDLNGPKITEEFPERFELLWGNFSHISQLLKKRSITSVDGILADFGTSQFQIQQGEGFSFNIDTPLDMRMSPGHHKVTAYDIINKASEAELAEIFYTYGEEFSSRKIASTIVKYRKEQGSIATTKELADVIMTVIPPYSRNVHPGTKVFQALRIVVNDELNNIKAFFNQANNLLKPDSNIVCISFHSLEDRIVKQYFKEHKNNFQILTPKVVTASQEELATNPSSRSAKLRAAKKK